VPYKWSNPDVPQIKLLLLRLVAALRETSERDLIFVIAGGLYSVTTLRENDQERVTVCTIVFTKHRLTLQFLFCTRSRVLACCLRNRGVSTPRRAADLEIGDPAPVSAALGDLWPGAGFFVVQRADETSSLVVIYNLVIRYWHKTYIPLGFLARSQIIRSPGTASSETLVANPVSIFGQGKTPFPSALLLSLSPIQRGDSCPPLPRVELVQKKSTKTRLMELGGEYSCRAVVLTFCINSTRGRGVSTLD
jgi:hypothetical protein